MLMTYDHNIVGILEPFFLNGTVKNMQRPYTRFCLVSLFCNETSWPSMETDKQTNCSSPVAPLPIVSQPISRLRSSFSPVLVGTRGTVRFFRLSASESPPESDGCVPKSSIGSLPHPSSSMRKHPGRLTAGTYSHHTLKRKENDLFTKPPGNYVPAVNLQRCICTPMSGVISPYL